MNFTIGKKGYDPEQVNAYIADLHHKLAEFKARAEAAESERAHMQAALNVAEQRIQELQSAQAAAYHQTPLIPEVAQRIGEEVQRVIDAATQAAVRITQGAEEEIARLRAESERLRQEASDKLKAAEAEAQRVRDEAQMEAARLREELARKYEEEFAELRSQIERKREELKEIEAEREQQLRIQMEEARRRIEEEQAAFLERFRRERELLESQIAELENRKRIAQEKLEEVQRTVREALAKALGDAPAAVEEAPGSQSSAAEVAKPKIEPLVASSGAVYAEEGDEQGQNNGGQPPAGAPPAAYGSSSTIDTITVPTIAGLIEVDRNEIGNQGDV